MLVGEAGIGKSRLAFELFRWVEDSALRLVGWRQARSGAVRRRVHLLGARRDRQGAGRDPRDRLGGGSRTQAQRGRSPTSSRNRARRPASSPTCRFARRARRARGDPRRPAPGSVRRLAPVPRSGRAASTRSCSSSRTCTGPTPAFSTSSSTFWTGRATCGSSSSAPHVPSSSSCDPTGGAGRTRRPSRSRRSRTTRSAELVAKLAPVEVPSETREAIVGAASGNPLFAVEFVRMLVDRPEEPPTAESVQAIIAARLDALTAEDKLLLQDAAVVGRESSGRACSSRSGTARGGSSTSSSASSCGRSSSPASRRRPSRERPEFRFRHALVRDEAYRQIPRLRKAEIHRRTAEWLESLSPDRTTERAEMLALHYMAAYEYARAANTDADGSGRGRAALVCETRETARSRSTRSWRRSATSVRPLDLWPERRPRTPGAPPPPRESRCTTWTTRARRSSPKPRSALLAPDDRESAAEAAMFLARLAHQRGGQRSACSSTPIARLSSWRASGPRARGSRC